MSHRDGTTQLEWQEGEGRAVLLKSDHSSLYLTRCPHEPLFSRRLLIGGYFCIITPLLHSSTPLLLHLNLFLRLPHLTPHLQLLLLISSSSTNLLSSTTPPSSLPTHQRPGLSSGQGQELWCGEAVVCGGS